MAKKKSTGHSNDKSGRTRVELRLDDEVHDRIKKLSDGAEITVNQLINGLVRWAGQNGHVGEPSRNADGVLGTGKQSGVVWFGRPGHYLGDEEKSHYWRNEEEAPEFIKGEHFLTLDFTERRVVREDI